MKKVKKYKISRRLQVPIFEKCQTQKFALREQGKQTKKGGRALSEYGKQLIEKQKIRYLYSITERNLKKYVDFANKTQSTKKNLPQNILAQALETRLDSVVYALGLALTRRMARQMVSHGHFCVNGKPCNIPSYQVSTTDVITIHPLSKNSTLIKQLLEQSKGPRASWVSFDKKNESGTIQTLPEGEIAIINFSSVLEYYSR
ncbi:MAG: 30S ribosomal protein S4 [Alphaproteobacteria bacterium]|nr:30S ribosomal protein S4 [Alphaproteobacteria bacterium]